MFQYIRELIDLRNCDLFDQKYYLKHNNDVSKSKINPLWHYIRHGWKEGRNPSDCFNTSQYLKLNPDVANKNVNPLWHYCKFGRREGRQLVPQFLLSNLDKRIREKNLLLAFSYLSASEVENINYLFLYPLFSTGGAELVGKNFIEYILEKNNSSSALIFTTDKETQDSIPSNDRVMLLNLANDLQILDWNYRKAFIIDFICAIRPSFVHIINSSVGWQILAESASLLTRHTRFYGSIFCNQVNRNGTNTGYADLYLSKTAPYLETLFSDNKRFLHEVQEAFPQVKECLCLPVYTPFKPVKKPGRLSNCHYPVPKRIKCLWAGRLDWQKKFDLVIDIAKNTPFIDIDVYGSSVMESMPIMPNISNLRYRGGFNMLETIHNVEFYDALIYTSRYDGLPNILIEAGRLGIPIIAPNIGGIAELVTEDTGFLVPANAGYELYRDALQRIMTNPKETRRRAENMFDLIASRHSWEKFVITLSSLPDYT